MTSWDPVRAWLRYCSKSSFVVPTEAAALVRGESGTEKELVAALKQSGGTIFEAEGAAELLAMKPATLASRIKKRGIDKSTI